MAKASTSKAKKRELLILRHAKSSWDEPELTDFERGLAPRGIKAARRMGKFIRKQGWVPDRVLCSSATRAEQTLALAAEQWKAPPPSAMLKTLYLAGPARMMGVVRRQADEYPRLLLIAHNPGSHNLALQLVGSQAPKTLVSNLATAALVRLRFNARSWSAVEDAELLDFIRPRDLD